MEYSKRPFKRIITEHKWVDPWFPFRYSLNPFSGCEYSCGYCRANWKENKQVILKENLLEQLTKEFKIKKIAPNSLVGVGGGINEIFSFDQEKNKQTMGLLKLVDEYKFNPFLITKNPNLFYQEIKNDSLLQQKYMDQSSSEALPILLISYSGLGSMAAHKKNIEPDIKEMRFEVIKYFKDWGVKVGGFISPLIPGINDAMENILQTIELFKKHGVDFIFYDWIDYAGLTHLNKKLGRENLARKTYDLVKNKKSHFINEALIKQKSSQKIPLRVPWSFYHSRLPLKDEIALVLMHYFFYKELLSDGDYRVYLHAALSLMALSDQSWQEKLSSNKLTSIPWVGEKINGLILGMAYENNFSFYTDYLSSNGFKV